MADKTRLRRIGEQVRIELAKLFRDTIDEPRLAFVSITHAEIARDLSHAMIYVTYIGDAADRNEIVTILNEESGYFRHELSQKMALRTVPALKFVYDVSIEEGARLQRKIENIVAKERPHEDREMGEQEQE